jgi:hypothetical protein
MADGFSPLDYRYLLLTTHYRSRLRFSYESLEAAKRTRAALQRGKYVPGVRVAVLHFGSHRRICLNQGREPRRVFGPVDCVAQGVRLAHR